MTGALLRTGSLDVFHPLGAEGSPVHAAAAQVRAAIARRLGREAADTFAIPQRNENGDTIDWYAPNPGDVVPWSAATEEERAQAKQRLEEVRAQIATLGSEMAVEPDSQRQVFARLLEHVCTFPSEEHVYLVDDRPVITFWGFRYHNAPAYTGAMLNLDALRAEQAAPRGIPWWWWLIGFLVLGALLLFLMRGCVGETPPVRDEGGPPPDVAGQMGIEEPAPATVEPLREIEEPFPDTPASEDQAVQETDLPDRLVDRSRVLSGDSVRLGQDRVADSDVVRTDDVQSSVLEDAAESVPTDDALLEGTEDADIVSQDEIVPEIDEPLPEDAQADGQTEPDVVDQDLEPPLDPEEVDLESGIPADEIEQAVEDEAVPVEEDLLQPEEEIAGDATDEDAPEIVQEPAETPDAEEPVPDLQPDEGTQPLQPDVKDAAPESIPEGEEAQQPGDAQRPKEGAAEGNGDTGTSPTEAGAAPGSRLQPMTIPPEAARTGSVRFANGGWRSSASLQDARGLPVDMGYRLKDGGGKVELRRHDGSVCAADVKAAMRDGKLVIDSASDIVCPDGANFGRPTMECKPGQDGRADCAGRYRTGERFSVDLGKLP